MVDAGARGYRNRRCSHDRRLGRVPIGIGLGLGVRALLAGSAVAALLAGAACDDSAPPSRNPQADGLWLQRVLVAAGFWDAEDVDRRHPWNVAISTGGPRALYVWFTSAGEGREGVPLDDGVRVRWQAQGLTVWAEPTGTGRADRSMVRRLVRASLAIRRRPPERSRRFVCARWLCLRTPASWSARGAAGGTVVATPVAPGWSRAVSVTVAPFRLPDDLGQGETIPSIPPGNYQIWITATRRSRLGVPAAAVGLTVSRRDRTAWPPPGVGIEFARTRKLGDRVFRAVVSMDRNAEVDAALAEANRVLRTLRTVE